MSNAKSNSVKAENYNVYKSNSKSNRKSDSVNTLLEAPVVMTGETN
jgi:hypothetical protein